MTLADIRAAVSGRPTPFAVPGAGSVPLRPLTAGERAALLDWFREIKDDPAGGFLLQRRLVALAVCDPAGGPVLTEDDVLTLPAPAVDAIAEEVARRTGLAAEGKAPAPTPTTPT